MEYNLSNFLSQADKAAIDNAIESVKKITSAEIKPLVVGRSSRRFTPKARQVLAVQERANREFFELGLDHTQEHVGVLIMVSLAEKRAEIRAGKAISEKVPDSTWNTVEETLISGIKKGSPRKGFVDAIVAAGLILASHFPVQPGDINEIPDHIVFKK